MGLLDNALSYVDSKKRALKRGLLDMVENPSQWAGMQSDRIREDRYGGAENAQAMTQYLSKKPYDKVAKGKAEDALRNAAVNESLGAITVWHGSPHKFDKFDMSKIGTGEGAQAYGHGLYMAEAPEVAKSYKFAGDATKELTYGGKPITDELKQSAAYLLHLNNYDKEAAKAVYGGKSGEKLAKIIDKMDTGKIGGGSLYKVDIPDEAVAKMLDWDKPLSQQHPDVLNSLRGESALKDLMSPMELTATTGQTVINRLANREHFVMKMPDGNVPLSASSFDEALDMVGGDPSKLMKIRNPAADAASEKLKGLGIPGIRYLDGGSRGRLPNIPVTDARKSEITSRLTQLQKVEIPAVKDANTYAALQKEHDTLSAELLHGNMPPQTSNYVLFDDQLPRILETNGQPTGLQPWGAGEWQGLLGK